GPVMTESIAERYSRLAQETEDQRAIDVRLRALDVLLAGLFLLLSLPLTIPIAGLVLLTSGRPLFYRGERLGRGGRVFTMLKLRTLRRGYETSMAEKLAHDLEWIADRSVRLYLRTLTATAWRVLRQSLRF